MHVGILNLGSFEYSILRRVSLTSAWHAQTSSPQISKVRSGHQFCQIGRSGRHGRMNANGLNGSNGWNWHPAWNMYDTWHTRGEHSQCPAVSQVCLRIRFRRRWRWAPSADRFEPRGRGCLPPRRSVPQIGGPTRVTCHVSSYGERLCGATVSHCGGQGRCLHGS